MSESRPQPNPSGFRAFLATGLRVLVTIMVAVGIGAGAYFTVSGLLPRFREQVLQPVEDNTIRLDNLSLRVEDGISELQDRLDSLSQRLDSGDITRDQLKLTQSALRSTLNELSSSQDGLVETVQTGQSLLTEQSEQFSSLSTQSARNQNLLSYLATQQIPRSALDHDRQMSVVRELMLRAAMSLQHQNYGLVEEDLSQAVELLEDLQESLVPHQAAYTQELTGLLVSALEALDESPELAGDALDLAWRRSTAGLPPNPVTGRPTFTPTPPPTSTPTPESSPTPAG